MPTLSDSKKKWEFGDLCAFGGHTLNVKKLTTIECSLPMANYPLKCPFCPDEQLIWRYDMGKHMETKHPDEISPAEGIVSKEEKEIINKKLKNTRNCLLKTDLEKLSDEALKLLPLKDFWDSRKKEWKSNAYGTFAKQQSARMKRLFGAENFTPSQDN